jgi:hypothetical protein
MFEVQWMGRGWTIEWFQFYVERSDPKASMRTGRASHWRAQTFRFKAHGILAYVSDREPRSEWVDGNRTAPQVRKLAPDHAIGRDWLN